eukprot:scaffold315176_cov32-Tisochrysis_lutea.AAC.1
MSSKVSSCYNQLKASAGVYTNAAMVLSMGVRIATTGYPDKNILAHITKKVQPEVLSIFFGRHPSTLNFGIKLVWQHPIAMAPSR